MWLYHVIHYLLFIRLFVFRARERVRNPGGLHLTKFPTYVLRTIRDVK